MEKLTIEILETPVEVARRAATLFVQCSKEAQAARGRFAVALAGGSTPRATYAELAHPPRVGEVDWERVEIFFGDERCVPPDHPDSNYRMAKESLLGQVPLPAEQVHRIAGELPPEEGAYRYQQTLVERLTPPVLDLALLGMGPDGHTASLFPGTAALEERVALVVPVYVPRLAAWRVTLTVPMLSSARQVVITAVGAEKAKALAQALEGPPDQVPVQAISPPALRWVVDRAAASQLSMKSC